MPITWKRARWALLALACLAAAVLWLRPGARPAAASDAPLPVQAVMVGPTTAGGGSMPAYAATLHRDREANLSFRVGGTISAMPARIGQHLPAGALVAALDATAYSAAAARAEAEAARSSRAATRYGALVGEGAVGSAQAADAADAARAAGAQLKAARFDLAATRLVMPFSGVVLARRAEQGETVGATQVVAQVADLASPLIATAQVPSALAAALRAGQRAEVSLAARPVPLAGRVLRIAGGADPRSDLVSIDIALIDAGSLPSGLAAAVRFPETATRAGGADKVAGLTIPAEALLEAQGTAAHVYVIDASGRARRRAVRFLGFDDQLARVEGLQPGEQVVTMGAGFVAEGARLQVVAP
jgi:RND family efflux transporter MFP subunit